jgi:L-ascorbate metabolism protein UlaG (beta-lactamase superfamily)
VKVNYYGHAAIGLEAVGGLRVLLDPYMPGAFDGRMGYGPIPGQWDIAIISHDHLDHNYIAPEFGKPAIVKGPCTVAGLEISTFVGCHGTNEGTMEATTQVSRFTLDDLTFVHPGDLADPVDLSLIANLKSPDVLFVPVGGRFTFDGESAARFVNAVGPRVAIPIHFKTSSVDLPIEAPDDFLDRFPTYRRFGSGTIELHTGNLPTRTQVWYLPPLCL